MKKKFVVPLKDAVTGDLHGSDGTFRHIIDRERCGAKHFSMSVNTLNAGVKTRDLRHDVEFGWYILSGTATFYIEGESFEIGPEMAIFAPATGGIHRFEVGPEDLTYVLIFAPPGPEQGYYPASD